jgi:hypothetical protein
LVSLFIHDRLSVVHIFGIPNVAKEMHEAAGRENAGVCIGLVDNDKRVPPYLLTFETVSEQNKVFLKRKGMTNQYCWLSTRPSNRFCFGMLSKLV